MNLLQKTIRLAHARRDLRPQLLPLILKYAVGMPSPSALKLLQVMAKGVGKTSRININLLEEALQALGWSVTQGSGMHTVGVEIIEDALFRAGVSSKEVWVGTDNGKRMVWARSEGAMQDALKRFHELFVVGSIPATPENGRIYIDKVWPPQKNITYAPWQPDAPIEEWKFAFKGGKSATLTLVFTNPAGKSVSKPVSVGEDLTNTQVAVFWTWAYKNGLREAASSYLDSVGREEVQRQTSPVSSRSLDNTGTCQVCARNIKLTSSKIITRHGWNVQGDRGRGQYGQSWHTGPCFGSGYEPFEVSKVGAERYREELKKYQKEKKRHAAQLQKGPDTVPSTHPRKTEDIPKGDPKYLGALRYWTRVNEGELEALAGELRTLEARIQSWTPRPLPGT